MPQIQDCKRELRRMFSLNPETMPSFVDVSAAELHRRVYGDKSRDTVVCCAAMRSELRDGDTIVAGSTDELGSGFTVRYALPRPNAVVQGDSQD